MRWARAISLLIVAACARPSADVGVDLGDGVVSLDYCADQYVLGLVPRNRIAALSRDAEKSFAYLRGEAAGLPKARGTAEDAIARRPGVVVRTYGGGPNAAAFFARAGARVVQIPYAADFDGVRGAIRSAAADLGAIDRGERLVAAMDARLAAIPRRSDGASALYMTPGGVTTGPGSLAHEAIVAAGLDNFARAPGWRALPLERLAYEGPDLAASAFFGAAPAGAWSAARHPIARAQLVHGRSVDLDAASLACGAWFVADAVEALARGE
ncbi:MAG: ABC transporter substrate-binding protein [Parvularculaceae bacterium]